MPPRRHFLAAGLVLTAWLGAAIATAQEPTPSRMPAIPPAPNRVLTMEEAIELALRRQPSLRAAQEARAAAQARVPQAQSSYYPRVDWISSGGRTQNFSSSLDRRVLSSELATEVEGRQLLYDFGKTAARVDEARAGLRDSEAELERIHDFVVLNVRRAYFELLRAQRLVGVAEAQIARAELNLRSAQGFFEVGTAPKSDVTRAEVEVANAEVARIRARNAVRLAKAALANALGLEPTTPIAVEDILSYEPVALDPVSLFETALANRPELAQAQARFDAARAQLAAARAGFGPDFELNAVYGGAADDLPLEERWAVGLRLSWNLFEGFFTTNRIRETKALVEAARAEAETVQLQVELEVEQAYVVVVDAAEAIAATEKAVESARENLRLAQGRYDAGVGTILDLTTAQFDLSSAEADQVSALTIYRVGLAELDRAIGRP